jgi:hypothetical protein
MNDWEKSFISYDTGIRKAVHTDVIKLKKCIDPVSCKITF